MRRTAGRAIELGPFTVFGAKDCPLTRGALPLVVISHGMGGSFTDHHDLAETLADAGFVVTAIDHPGDTFLDKSRIGDLSVMVERPTDIKRVTDFMLSAAPAASNIDAQRIGFFGFSAGGYTGLVLIGADPDWAVPLCRRSPTPPACEQILRKQFRVEPLAHDSRIKAAVIADPCCAWFTEDSFSALKVPVQLWASERQTRLNGMPMPSAKTVAALDRGLSAEHEFHVVPNSTHFGFLFVCPPAVASAAPPEICTDAPGFDRAAFHKEFDAAVLAFFGANLGGI